LDISIGKEGFGIKYKQAKLIYDVLQYIKKQVFRFIKQ